MTRRRLAVAGVVAALGALALVAWPDRTRPPAPAPTAAATPPRPVRAASPRGDATPERAPVRAAAPEAPARPPVETTPAAFTAHVDAICACAGAACVLATQDADPAAVAPVPLRSDEDVARHEAELTRLRDCVSAAWQRDPALPADG